jgi:hypothetical protein
MTAGFFVRIRHCEERVRRSNPVLPWDYWVVRFALALLTVKYAPRKLMSATMVTASNT